MALTKIGLNLIKDTFKTEISGSITESSSSFSTRVTTAESELGNTIVSSSAQISTDISGSFSKVHFDSKLTNVVTSSAQLSTDISGSFSKEHLAAKVANVVTSSAQLSTDISGSFSKEHLAAKVTNVVTSSAQIATDISGSFSKEHLAAKVANVVTSSAQLSTDISGSFGNQRVGTADAVTFATVNTGQGANELYDMNQNVKTDSDVTFSNATITNTLSAQEIHTRFVSASVTLATGSNQFGDALTDVQNFTGSVNMSSSLSVFGHPTEKTLISGSSVSASSAQFSTAQIDKFTGAIDFNNENMTNVDIDSGVITGITDLVVADGGTGVSTLTDGGVLLGNGAGAIQAMAVLTDGQMIVGDGTTDPVAESGATLRTSIGVGTGDDVVFSAVSGSTATFADYVGNVSGSSTSTGSFGAGYFDNKVGIGTTTPPQPLTVAGNISGSSGLDIDGAVNFGGDLTLEQAGQAIVHINSSGDAAELKLTSSKGVWSIFSDNVSDNFLIHDGATRFAITGSTGYVGIGTSSPTGGMLDIKQSAAYEGVRCIAHDNNNYTGTFGMGDAGYTTIRSNGDRGMDLRSNSQMRFYIDDADTLGFLITAAGKVGIGTASPTTLLTLAKNNVISINTSDGADNGYLGIVGAGADGQSRGATIYLSGNERTDNEGLLLLKAGNNSSNGVIVFEVANDLVKAKIGYNGDFFTNDGSVSDLSSDIRTKKNITDLEDGLNILNKLRPVTFEYNGKDDFHEDDGRIFKGFIADEVKEVAPFYMDEGKGTIDDVEVDDFKTISKSRMIPMMIKSIQELSSQVKEQAKRIKELEN